METSEKSKDLGKKSRKFSKLKSIVTSIALAFGAASCDNIPNDQIIVNPTSQSVELNLEYQYFQGSAGTEIVDYDVKIYKDGDLYKCDIKQKGGILSTTTSLQAYSLDELIRDISKEVDNEQISDETRYNKDVKLDFAKQVYKDSVLNNKNPSEGETRIKYNKK